MKLRVERLFHTFATVMRNIFRTIIRRQSYKTTILRDIEKISELIAPKLPFKISNIHEYKALRRLTFRVVGEHIKKVEKLPLTSLKSRTVFDSWEHTWEACLDEYEEKFNSNMHLYREAMLDKISHSVRENICDIRYQHIFIKYEDSIHTTYNALKEYLHLNKSIELDSEIMKKAHTIFNSLKSALEKREGEIANLEKEKDKASNKSYLERLDNEIEYIEKYVE